MIGRLAYFTGLFTTAALVLAACSNAPDGDRGAPAAVPTSAPATSALPRVIVHKTESCGCCTVWVEHLERAGFAVEVHNESNLNAIKERLGVPYAKGSCHTAEVDGYVVEGHVPAQEIRRLLAERPDARGLTVPGMPAGSPGMEMPDGRTEPYTVELIERNGSTRPYAEYPGSNPTR